MTKKKSELMAAMRNRRREMGLIRVEYWLTPDDEKYVSKIIENEVIWGAACKMVDDENRTCGA